MQNVRAGAPGPLTVTLTSGTPAVGTLVTSAGSGATRTVQIPIGLYYSPTSVATGGVAFNVLLGGTTVVSASIPNLIQTTSAVRTVTVSAPGITVSSPTVGAGLQVGASVSLGTANHGGVTVHVQSSQPGVALVSPDATTPGTASIDVVVPNGSGSFSYYVQGVEQQANTVQITATAPGFTTGTANGDRAAAGLRDPGADAVDHDLRPGQSILRPGRTVQRPEHLALHRAECPGGCPGPAHRDLHQRHAGGRSPGDLRRQWRHGDGPDPDRPLLHADDRRCTGGVALDALTAGSTVVTAAIPTYIPTAQATRTVDVATFYITTNGTTVGAGLQAAGIHEPERIKPP